MKNYYKWSFLSFLFCFTEIYASKDLVNIGNDIITGPFAVLRKLMNGAFYVIGISLIIISISKYQRYKQNPQEVPLLEPIIYFVLGLILALIPIGYVYLMNHIK